MSRRPDPDPDDEELTPAELAAECKVAIYTVYSWRRRGQGPRSYKLAGNLRYRRSEVNRWRAEQGDTALIGQI